MLFSWWPTPSTRAPLFIAAGVLEEAYGTREITRLRGALRAFPITGLAITISLLSLLGVPVLPGFVGKEYLLKSTWAVSPWLAFTAAASFAAVIALAARAFAPLASRGQLSRPVHRPAREVQLAPWLSTAAALVLTAAFPWIEATLLQPASGALQADGLTGLKLWPGLSPVLALSVGALALGILAARSARPPAGLEDGTSLGDRIYRTLFNGLVSRAKSFAAFLQNRTLRTHLTIVLAAVGLLVASQLVRTGLPTPTFTLDKSSAVPAVLATLVALAGLGAAVARTRLALLALLGLLGLLIALLFSYFSAPDLALTQLLTETILIVLLVAVLRRIPKRTAAQRKNAHPLAFVIAVLGGMITTALVLKAKALELTPPVSGFFTENSLTEAYGANIVNVILVDFPGPRYPRRDRRAGRGGRGGHGARPSHAAADLPAHRHPAPANRPAHPLCLAAGDVGGLFPPRPQQPGRRIHRCPRRGYRLCLRDPERPRPPASCASTGP